MTKCIRHFKFSRLLHFPTHSCLQFNKSQLELISVNAAVTRKWGVPALKAAMDYMGLFGGITRKPMLPVNDKIKQQLVELIDKHIKSA